MLCYVSVLAGDLVPATTPNLRAGTAGSAISLRPPRGFLADNRESGLDYLRGNLYAPWRMQGPRLLRASSPDQTLGGNFSAASNSLDIRQSTCRQHDQSATARPT